MSHHRAPIYSATCFLLLTLASLISTGCGFTLRGSVGLPFETIFIDAPKTSLVATELTRQLTSLQKAQGGTRLLTKDEKAQVTFRVLNEVREKEVLGFSTSGAQRDYQLRLRFKYQLLNDQKDLMGDPIEIVLRRDVSTIDSQLTAKQEEDVLLYREMQSDLVQQLLSRLAATKVKK